MKYLIALTIFIAPLSAQEDVFIALHVLDGITTHYGVTMSHGATELNPLVPADDIAKLVLFKAVFITLYLKQKPPKKEFWIINFITAIVVSNNMYQIHRRFK